MTLLEQVLGKELADACLDEIVERSHPEDSDDLTSLLRDEIVGKYVRKAQLTIEQLQEIFLKGGNHRPGANFSSELKRTLEIIDNERRKLINATLVRELVADSDLISELLVRDMTSYSEKEESVA